MNNINASAFVSAFTPALFGRAPSAVSKRAATTSTSRGRIVMEKSASVPFMDAPAGINSSMPGYVGFDPLNISSFLNVKWLQEAEIKHGRICMLAILGLVVAEVYQLPWYSDFPKLVIDRHTWGVQNGSMLQLLIWCSFFEIMTLPAVVQMIKGESDRAPGYFGLDPLNIGSKDSLMAQKEVKNGRLAIVAVSGAIHHAAITNQNLLEQITAGNILAKIPFL